MARIRNIIHLRDTPLLSSDIVRLFPDAMYNASRNAYSIGNTLFVMPKFSLSDCDDDAVGDDAVGSDAVGDEQWVVRHCLTWCASQVSPWCIAQWNWTTTIDARRTGSIRVVPTTYLLPTSSSSSFIIIIVHHRSSLTSSSSSTYLPTYLPT